MATTKRDLAQGQRIAENLRYLNLSVVIAAALADERERVLNLARDVIDRETSAYPDASPTITSGIFGGFDQWAMACIDGREIDPDGQTHRLDCTCGCSWGAHRSGGSCEDCECQQFDEEKCTCVGLMHQTGCANEVEPR